MPFNASSRILLTGGTGSFGKAFIAATLQRFPDLKRLVVYSRDELKQWELQQLFPADQFPQLRFLEAEQRFDQEFIALARSVYQLNDQRAALKRQINEACGSTLVEEKSYGEQQPATTRIKNSLLDANS